MPIDSRFENDHKIGDLVVRLGELGTPKRYGLLLSMVPAAAPIWTVLRNDGQITVWSAYNFTKV